MIQLWDGELATFQNTSLNNWQAISDLNHRLVISTNPFITIKPINFDLTKYVELNRDYRNSFINNASIAINFLLEGFNQCNSMLFKHADHFSFEIPVIPTQLTFDTTSINNFWQAISDDYLFLFNVANTNKL